MTARESRGRGWLGGRKEEPTSANHANELHKTYASYEARRRADDIADLGLSKDILKD